MHMGHLGWGWGGLGGGNNVHVNLNTHGLYGVHSKIICIWVISGGVRVGWGGGNNVHVNLKICHATLWDILLHYLALALCIFVFGEWGMGWGGACKRSMNFNFVNVTFVQTIKSLSNMKSRLLVLRSL